MSDDGREERETTGIHLRQESIRWSIECLLIRGSNSSKKAGMRRFSLVVSLIRQSSASMHATLCLLPLCP